MQRVGSTFLRRSILRPRLSLLRSQAAWHSVWQNNEFKVLYGSQTGTGMCYSKLLARTAKKKNLKMTVQNLHDVDCDALLNEKYLIFVLSCFGEGQPSDSAKKFFAWLMDPKRETEEHWKFFHYSIFGLGNSEYGGERYQKVAKDVDKRFSQLGATRLLNLGTADDHGNGEGDWEEWSEAFWQALQTGGEPEVKKVDQAIKIYPLGAQPTTTSYYRPFDQKVYDHTNPFHAPVTQVKSLYHGEMPRSGKHIELSLKGSGVTYETGDYLAVWPRNEDRHVEALGKRLGVDIDSYFSIAKDHLILENFPPCFPNPITIRETFSQYCDLTLPPKRFTIQCLAPFATQQDEREKLERLSDAKLTPQAEYEAQFYKKDFATILNDFPSIKLSLTEALELMPSARFRYYSISSSSQAFPDSVHLTMCRKAYGAPDNCTISTCATFLDHLKVGDFCPIHVTKSEFKLPPAEQKLPIIMIAVGTGYAPMRGFLQQRVLEENHENMLFCGYYHKNEDFIYSEEVEQLMSSGFLPHMYTAFSHDQPEIIFVQHRILDQSLQVWKYLQKGAHILICGNLAMGRSVTNALLEVVAKEGRMNAEEAQVYMDKIGTEGRFHRDLFA